ncbi:hypothetical protein [Methylobacterium sp. Leaf117]|uniref:PGN_0703 family putative restriction endonuclease n=1 Tax=Methylobacterium sp. Leaf117 TaxID=1736260 RepID=UPI0009EB9DCD|nr:hypothetical protein [Methylobacterium sp. Leaf117]
MSEKSASHRSPTAFLKRERTRQAAFFKSHHEQHIGFGGKDYRLQPASRALNLEPSIRKVADAYFARHRICWHQHANHALSSQVCCLNFLMPLARSPKALSRLVGRALSIAPPTMLPIDSEADEPCYVAFEWIGRADYLNEGGATGARTRGANATSADAIVRFQTDTGIETLLIEWKYTESYGQPVGPAGNITRIKRYEKLAFSPDGPLRTDLDITVRDFFWEPFYQLIRQQILARRMQGANEDGTTRVRVLHISPCNNLALHRVTSPGLRRFGNDAFAVYKSTLSQPLDFVSWSTRALFATLLGDPGDNIGWADYLIKRYEFLADVYSGHPVSAVGQIM